MEKVLDLFKPLFLCVNLKFINLNKGCQQHFIFSVVLEVAPGGVSEGVSVSDRSHIILPPNILTLTFPHLCFQPSDQH